ncbi:unnamed protein product [Closterium sp. NIES-54]
MYGLSVSTEGDCYRCVPPDPGIAAAALGASESGTLPRTATTLTPLPALVLVRLADPSWGPVIARSSTVLPCPAVPFGSLSGLHLPSFSTNLVSTAALQDAMVTTTNPGGQRVSICTCTQTGRHLATFTRRPGSSLYTPATEPPQVAASAQTLLWHHRLGHPSLPRLRDMHSRLLVSGLPRSLPPLPLSPALPCLLCVEGQQRAAPHSSFPPTTAPLQTLRMYVWGPARVSGQSRELVADNYTQYTTVFPLRSKGQVVDVLIPWIRTVRLQLRERFGQDLPVLRVHFDRGVMEVACTSMIHADAPDFLWPFAVRYAAHQLNLWRRVSLPETSPTLRWKGKDGDATVFWVRGSCAFVRDPSADKLSDRAIPCVFLGFVPDARGWQFYHPTSRRVLPSQDVTFDKCVPFYRLFPYRSAPLPPPPLFLAPGPPLVDPLPPQGTAPSGVSQVDPPPGAVPGEIDVDSGAARGTASRGAELGGAETGGAEPGGVETGGAEPGGAEPEGVEPGGAASEGAESGGAEPQGAASSGARGARAGGAGVAAGGGVTGGTAATGPGGARTRGTGAAGTGGIGARGARVGGTDAGGAGVGGTGARGAGAGGVGAVDPGGAVRPRPYFVPLLQQDLGTPSSTGLTPPLLCPPPDQSQPPLQPASPVPAPSTYTETSGSLTEHREPASGPLSPVRTARRVPRSRPPPVLGTHAMTLRPSSVPLRVPLPASPGSSLPEVSDPESDLACAANPTVSRLLATAVTDPPLDSASALVAESASACPPSVGGECALGTDVLEDRQEDFECLATAVSRFASMLLAPEGDPDAPDIPTPRSYAEAITGTQWSLRQLVYGLREVHREWHDTLRTTIAALGFAPSTADPSLFLRTDTSLPPFYALVYIDDLIFATADTEALTLVMSELEKRHTCTHLGELRSYLGLQITRDRARGIITLTQSHMVHQVLQRFGFQFSSPQPTPLSTSHSLSAPPSNESVEPSGPYPELVDCLMHLMTCTRPDQAYPLNLLARYVAPGRHRKVQWDAAKRVLRYLCSTSGMGLVLGGRGPVVLSGHANASWELRWLTYLLTDLGEQPRSRPLLYIDNKAMIALCQEHRLEHRTKHIALRYFLAREMQQRGQLRLAYVATRSNSANIFTKALLPGDH